MVAYSDADWAGCTEAMHQTTGLIIFANGSPVSWNRTK